jgi:hypothetical protein
LCVGPLHACLLVALRAWLVAPPLATSCNPLSQVDVEPHCCTPLFLRVPLGLSSMRLLVCARRACLPASRNFQPLFALSTRRLQLCRNCVSTVNLDFHPDLAHIATHARNAEYNPKVRAHTCLHGLRRCRERVRRGLCVCPSLILPPSGCACGGLLPSCVCCQFMHEPPSLRVSSHACAPPLTLSPSLFRCCSPFLQRFSAAVIRLRDPKATALLFQSGKVHWARVVPSHHVWHPTAALVFLGSLVLGCRHVVCFFK